MRNEQFFKYTTLFLLLINIGLICFFFFSKPNHHHKNRRPNFLNKAFEILELDDQQKNQFEKLAEQHHQEILKIERTQKQKLAEYFEPLKRDTAHNLLLQKQNIKALESQKIEVTYKHFLEVKKLLRDDQLDNFELFIDEFVQILLLRAKKNKKRAKESSNKNV